MILTIIIQIMIMKISTVIIITLKIIKIKMIINTCTSNLINCNNCTTDTIRVYNKTRIRYIYNKTTSGNNTQRYRPSNNERMQHR